MKINRKRHSQVLLLVVLSLLLLACGGGSNGGTLLLDPPVISNMTYSPTSASLNSMPINMTVGFDFADAGGNIISISTGVSPVFSDRFSTSTYALSIPAGTTEGHATITWTEVSFSQTGTYTGAIYVTDRLGTISNHLTASFTIY